MKLVFNDRLCFDRCIKPCGEFFLQQCKLAGDEQGGGGGSTFLFLWIPRVQPKPLDSKKCTWQQDTTSCKSEQGTKCHYGKQVLKTFKGNLTPIMNGTHH